MRHISGEKWKSSAYKPVWHDLEKLMVSGALPETFLSLLENDGENEIQIGQDALKQRLGGAIPSGGLAFLKYIGAFTRSRSGNNATVYKIESRKHLEGILTALIQAARDASERRTESLQL